MAILLKTASVRVSSIQIMQIRVQNKGKRVRKSRYVGDVSNKYVSGLRLRVIRISVKACIDVTLYDELLITSINEKHLLSSSSPSPSPSSSSSSSSSSSLIQQARAER